MASLSARMVEAADGGDGDLLSWVARYGDEGSCEEALMRLRFPGGWVDLAAVLICYDAYVPRGGSRSRAGLALLAARDRFAEHAPWFDKTYAVKSFLDYANALLLAFAMILDA